MDWFTILRAAIGGGHGWIAATMVALLAVVFVGMARPILAMLFDPEPLPATPIEEPALSIAGPIVLTAIVLGLGVYIPPPLERLLGLAARSLGGIAP